MSTLEQEIEFPKLDYDLIIAMRGLPCTGKSEIANAIGKWAGSPVLYIDDFLYTLYKEKGYTCESPPPNGEAARLHKVAFDGLCEAASHRQRQHNRCVVIKSRLDSTDELERLAQLGLEGSFRKILIIECRTKNEYRWERWSEKKLKEQKDRHWYKPKNWRGVREYRDDILGGDPLDFGHHFRRLFLESETLVFGCCISPFRFQVGGDARKLACWIEVDPFNDLTLDPSTQHTFLLTPSFLHVIKQLLSRGRPRVTSLFLQPLFPAMAFQKLRFDLLLVDVFREEEGGRSEHICGKGVKRCAFGDDDDGGGKCGACEEAIAIDSGKRRSYCCAFCPLSLHESCATLRGFQSRGFEKLDLVKKHPYWADDPQQACDSCIEGKKSFSHECYSCLYQNYLKQRVFPTIVDHKSHRPCMLSIKFDKNSVCKACNDPIPLCSYGCYLCSVSYHMECLLLPQRLEHEHGGYRHDMELKYSRSRMDQLSISIMEDEDEDEDRVEEGYWCDVCYQEMDPRNWFYSCQNCHYEAHPLCTNPFSKYEEEFASKLRETASSSTP